MRDVLVDKLRSQLSDLPVNTEAKVAYLLATVRKLLERDNPDPKPFALWMYCHWAMHLELSKPGTTGHFLERIDKFIFNTVAGFAGGLPFSVVDEHRLFRDFIYFDTFRNQLRDLLQRYQLPTDLCDDDNRWFSIVSAYAGIIEAGALSIKDKNASLQAIEKVTFYKGRPYVNQDPRIPFSLRWEAVLKDGRRVESEVEAISSIPGSNMMGHSLRVISASSPKGDNS